MQRPPAASPLPMNRATATATTARQKKSATELERDDMVPRLYVDLFINNLLVKKISDNMTEVLDNLRKHPSTDNEMNEIVNNTESKMTAIQNATKDSAEVFKNILRTKKTAIQKANDTSEVRVFQGGPAKRTRTNGIAGLPIYVGF